MQWKTRFIIVAALLLSGLPVPALACSICIGFPDKTDVDYLLEADCVLLAREHQQDPFSFAPYETLKGSYEGAAINLLVDSRTRRVLQTNPDRSVILVRDVQEGEFRSLGLVSDQYVSIARRVLLTLSDSKGRASSQQRWEFFVTLFGHNDARIRELAYLELGRAPYRVVRQISRVASRGDWMPMLNDPRYLEWQSLAILLLAQSDQPQDQQRVRDAFHSAHRFGLTTNLAAWAAAAIEVDRESAIKFIEDKYFRRAESTSEELAALAKALSMHGSQPDQELQDRIVASYRVLLEHHPELGPHVAGDLYAWERSDLIDRLAAIRNSAPESDTARDESIERYLRATSPGKESALASE